MPSCQVQAILRRIPTLYQMDPSFEINKVREQPAKPLRAAKKDPRKAARRNIRSLAEAVILQSVEDLWSKTDRERSIEFFTGEGFSLCAEMAGMKIIDRLRFFRLLRKLDNRAFDSRHAKKVGRIINRRHLP